MNEHARDPGRLDSCADRWASCWSYCRNIKDGRQEIRLVIYSVHISDDNHTHTDVNSELQSAK